MTTTNAALNTWVEEVCQLTKPDRVHWCTGSEEEYKELVGKMVGAGQLQPLNPETYPNCYLHRSDPTDVARVEHLTFVCTREQEDAGPNNNWMDPDEAKQMLDGLFSECMRNRTLYVVPYCMGPIDSPFSRCGVELTDSPYVAVSLRLMTRMGTEALARIERENKFVKGLHSIGDLNPERRFIMHFPEELSIRSIGSNYGGNALLSKKCHALRIASWQARDEGWLAEHMLLMGVQSPSGERHHIACAFPSACGKTNLAMLVPPDGFDGWKVDTVGEDISWLHIGPDRRIYAINPENGYFGVVPGTNRETNENAYRMIHHDAIFTNVAVTADNEPWWEGKSTGEPMLDWRGRPFEPANGPAAHPNSRFTVSAHQNPTYSPRADDPSGVPISAIVFGGRRREVAPLVYEARSWQHGILVGAGMGSETTAAAAGEVGVTRRDPMAMKPFCGYNFGDYWRHWLSFEGRVDRLPKIFHVNWFRKDADDNFLWPGFGQNLRVLKWIIDRCEGRAAARETPIGLLPHARDLELGGLAMSPDQVEALLSIDRAQWRQETRDIADYLEGFGERVPDALRREHRRVEEELENAD